MANRASDAATSSTAPFSCRISAVTAVASPMPNLEDSGAEDSDSSTNLQCFQSALHGPPESPMPSFLQTLASPCRIRGLTPSAPSPGSGHGLPHHADSPVRRRRVSCVDGSALFGTPADKATPVDGSSLFRPLERTPPPLTAQVPELPLEQLMEPQLDKIFSLAAQPTDSVGLVAPASPSFNGEGACPMFTPAGVEDPHTWSFSARQRLFEREAGRRDSEDFATSVRAVLFRDGGTTLSEQPMASSATQPPSIPDIAVVAAPITEGESVVAAPIAEGESASVEEAAALEIEDPRSELDDATAQEVPKQKFVTPMKASAHPQSHSPESNVANVGVGTSRRAKKEFVRRGIAMQEREEQLHRQFVAWRTEQMNCVVAREQQVGNRERAVATQESAQSARQEQLIERENAITKKEKTRQEQLAERENAISRQEKACLEQLVERENAIARQEQALNEQGRELDLLEQSLVEREHVTVGREKAVAFHLGRLHTMGSTVACERCRIAGDDVPLSEAMPNSRGGRCSTVTGAARCALRAGKRCLVIVLNVLGLHALLLALPLERQVALTPTWQLTLEPGLIEQMVSMWSPAAAEPENSTEPFAAFPANGSGFNESVGLDTTQNTDRTTQSIDSTFTSAVSMGSGLLVYAATFMIG